MDDMEEPTTLLGGTAAVGNPLFCRAGQGMVKRHLGSTEGPSSCQPKVAHTTGGALAEELDSRPGVHKRWRRRGDEMRYVRSKCDMRRRARADSRRSVIGPRGIVDHRAAPRRRSTTPSHPNSSAVCLRLPLRWRRRAAARSPSVAVEVCLSLARVSVGDVLCRSAAVWRGPPAPGRAPAPTAPLGGHGRGGGLPRCRRRRGARPAEALPGKMDRPAPREK